MPRYRTRLDSIAMQDAPTDGRVRDVVPAPAVGRVPGNAVLTATLPNGRTTWFRVDPAPVPIEQINRLARQSAQADVRHALHTRDTARALGRLRTTLSRDVAALADARLERQRKLGAQVTKGDTKLEAKITKATRQLDADGSKRTKGLLRAAVRIRRRAVWDYAVLATAAPLFAAFGQRSKPWGSDNVTLAAALGVWLAGDEITDLISGRPDDPPTLVRDVDLWSYLAPAGNLLAGFWLLQDAQHHRFITGAAAGDFTARVGLGQGVAPSASSVLSAATLEAVQASVKRDREAVLTRIRTFVAGLTEGEKARFARVFELMGKRLLAMPAAELRSLLPAIASGFMLDLVSPGVVDDTERNALRLIGENLGLSAADVAALESTAGSFELIAAAVVRLMGYLRAAPLEERREFFWSLDAMISATGVADPPVREYRDWIAAALGLRETQALDVQFIQAIDLANDRVAPGFAEEFAGLADVPATAVLAAGVIAPEFVTSTPQVSAKVDGGVLTIVVRVQVFGCAKGIVPPPAAAEVTAPVEGPAAEATPPVEGPAAEVGATPAVITALVPASPRTAADDKRARLLSNRRLRYVAAGDFVEPETRAERFELTEDLRELFEQHLWATPPTVAWIVDTLVPK
jgi:hypothetical protein